MIYAEFCYLQGTNKGGKKQYNTNRAWCCPGSRYENQCSKEPFPWLSGSSRKIWGYWHVSDVPIWKKWFRWQCPRPTECLRTSTWDLQPKEWTCENFFRKTFKCVHTAVVNHRALFVYLCWIFLLQLLLAVSLLQSLSGEPLLQVLFGVSPPPVALRSFLPSGAFRSISPPTALRTFSPKGVFRSIYPLTVLRIISPPAALRSIFPLAGL